MAAHSSILAWRIPGTGEPGGLPSMGSHRVGHDWSDLAAAAAAVCILLLVQLLSCVWLSATPRTAVCQAPLTFTISRNLLKLMSIELMIPSNHLILCHPLLLLPSIFPASGSFPMSWFFALGGQSIGASASVLPMSIQGWFPLGLTGLILLSKELSRVFSSTTVRKHHFFSAQPFSWSNSHIHTWLLEKP